MHVSPVILYSIAEYGNAPTVEYDHFLTWNNIYLNDRQRELSVLVPAHMLGKLKSFFSEAVEMVDRESRREDQFDPSKHVYNGMFNLLTRYPKILTSSAANNSIGSFCRENSKVHLDILVTLQISNYGYLRIGFRRTITRLPLAANGVHAQQLVLYTQQSPGDIHA